MGFFDALDDTFGGGTALGAIEGFEEKQYELGLIQEEKNKRFDRQLEGAAKGLGTVMSKRKALNEQITTFASALENDSSLKKKLGDAGLLEGNGEGLRELARSALNTRYAALGASGSKFKTEEFVRQVGKTSTADLMRFKKDPEKSQTDEIGRKVTAKDESITGGLFGNFANILSPTRAGQEQRRVAREKLAGQFPDATAKEIAEAIATYGVSAGTTKELETDTPFSVGVLTSPPTKKAYQGRVDSLLEGLAQRDAKNNPSKDGSTTPQQKKAAFVTRAFQNDAILTDDYSGGEGDRLQEDTLALYNYLSTNSVQNENITMNDIRKTMSDKGITRITEYIKFMLENGISSSNPIVNNSSSSTPSSSVASPQVALEDNVTARPKSVRKGG